LSKRSANEHVLNNLTGRLFNRFWYRPNG